MRSILDRVRRHVAVLRASGELVLWTLAAAGVALAFAGLLEPLWPIRFLSRHLPGLLTAPLEWLGLSPTAALIVYGVLLSAAALGVFWAALAWSRAHHREAHLQLRERLVLRLLAPAGFVGGFVGARAIVVGGSLALPGHGGGGGGLFTWPFREIWVEGYHLHHFFLGFLVLAVVGWISVFHPGKHRRWLAALYGVGMGVFVDEGGAPGDVGRLLRALELVHGRALPRGAPRRHAVDVGPGPRPDPRGAPRRASSRRGRGRGRGLARCGRPATRSPRPRRGAPRAPGASRRAPAGAGSPRRR